MEETKQPLDPSKEPEPPSPVRARPDDVFVPSGPREKEVVWTASNGNRYIAKVLYKEVPWPIFSEIVVSTRDAVHNTFDIKRYLVEMSKLAVMSVEGQAVKPEDILRWTPEFGVALMNFDIIPSPSFGGGSKKF